MNNSTAWQKLKTAELVSGEVPKFQSETSKTLWYVRVLQGFAGWLAAFFILGFLGFGLAVFFEHGVLLMILGLALNVSAYVFYKSNNHSDFFEQLVLVFSLTGQFLFAFGLFQLFEYRERHWLVWVGLYQLLLMVLINNYLHRFLSTWFAVIALFWGFDVLIYSGLGSALVAALFVWLWLDKCNWEAEKEFYEPIAYALAFSLFQLNVQSEFILGGVYWYKTAETNWIIQNADWISALLNSMVLLYFVYRMVQEQNIKLSTTTGSLVILAAVVMLFSALPVIGLSSALLVLLVGFARQNKLLLVMGVLALLGFVGWYYYSLHMTLLQKSMILMVIGAVLLLGGLMLKYTLSKQKILNAESTLSTNGFELTAWQKIAAILTLVVGLVGVNHAIWQKEQVLVNGQSVYLELAPVDPRSIMQGDYMRLRFAMANQIQSNQPQDSFPGKQENKDGYVMVKLDEQGVGRFDSLWSEAADESIQNNSLLRLQYRIRNNNVQFATNAFFFQEGDAKLFDAAKYGEFKVADDGELLLTAMYDKDLVLLGKNRMK